MPEQRPVTESYTIQLINILRDNKPFATIGPTYFGLSDKNVIEFEAAMSPIMAPLIQALVALGIAKAEQKGLSPAEAEAIKDLAARVHGSIA